MRGRKGKGQRIRPSALLVASSSRGGDLAAGRWGRGAGLWGNETLIEGLGCRFSADQGPWDALRPALAPPTSSRPELINPLECAPRECVRVDLPSTFPGTYLSFTTKSNAVLSPLTASLLSPQGFRS
ncbi:hypothetical protein MTO96_005351 [Rhipicephalus appendiculatus]